MQRRRRHSHRTPTRIRSATSGVQASLTFLRPGSTWRLIHPARTNPIHSVVCSPLPILASPAAVCTRSPCHARRCCGERESLIFTCSTISTSPLLHAFTRLESRSPRRHQQHLHCVPTYHASLWQCTSSKRPRLRLVSDPRLSTRSGAPAHDIRLLAQSFAGLVCLVPLILSLDHTSFYRAAESESLTALHDSPPLP